VAVVAVHVAAFGPVVPRVGPARVGPLRVAMDPLIQSTPGAHVAPTTCEADWEVHKFGGASLATEELYRTVGDLLIREAKREGPAIPTMAVVSAMGGMTDRLIGVVDAALVDLSAATAELEAAVALQVSVVRALAPAAIAAPIEAEIRSDAADVLAVVKSLRLIKTVPAVTMEVVTGFGEIWSARTLHAYLQTMDVPTAVVDARDVLVVKSDAAGLGEKGSTSTTGVVPLWRETSALMAAWWEERSPALADAPVLVCTGFVATTADGVPTTLKRSGSDYSATIFARLLGASRVTMWKNTDGVYTADPRRVPEAFPIASLKYDEAMELAYFGAQVLHPSAMVPCIDDNIPVYVRNIFNPTFPGTVIRGRSSSLSSTWEGRRGSDGGDGDGEASDPDASLIKGVTSIDDANLLTLEGAQLAGGASAVGERVLGALRAASVSALMITQASSEASITVAVPATQGKTAIAALQAAFELELARSTVNTIFNREHMAIVAIVGEGMAKAPGASATFMSALARAGVNIAMIAQGSSERQIAVAVDAADATRALRAAHAAFTLSAAVTSVAVLGATGRLGAETLGLVRDRADSKGLGVDIRLTAIASSTKMRLAKSEKGGFLWGTDIDDSPEALDLEALTAFLVADVNPQRIVVDATSSEAVAGYYERWLNAGISVVSASKTVAAGDSKRYEAVTAAAARNRAARWKYESAVGAALPILGTLSDLLATGDGIERIRGCLSGTMAYCLREYRPGVPFTDAVEAAVALGYAEPDPREDLSGEDMARKVVILARALGMAVDYEDVEVDSVLPEGLAAEVYAGGDVAARVLEDLRATGLDADMEARQAGASSRNAVLRYAFEIDVKANRCSVTLAEVETVDPLYRLKKNENLVAFTTERYVDAPLIVKGAGAGATLAASGVVADILRLARSASDRPPAPTA